MNDWCPVNNTKSTSRILASDIIPHVSACPNLNTSLKSEAIRFTCFHRNKFWQPLNQFNIYSPNHHGLKSPKGSPVLASLIMPERYLSQNPAQKVVRSAPTALKYLFSISQMNKWCFNLLCKNHTVQPLCQRHLELLDS